MIERINGPRRKGAGKQHGRGHPGLPANPHIRPAFDANRSRMVNTYRQTVRRKLLEFARKVYTASLRERR